MEDLPYTTAQEFLALFDIDTERKGARDFCELVRRMALLRRFPDLRVGSHEIAAYDMSVRHCSPLVYWSNMRRAIAPAVEADRDTLRALLGFSLPGEGKITVYALAVALSGSLSLITAEWYRRLMEHHSRKDIPDDMAAPIYMAQDSDRQEAEELAAAIRARSKKK